jgi:hypothetical protein
MPYRLSSCKMLSLSKPIQLSYHSDSPIAAIAVNKKPPGRKAALVVVSHLLKDIQYFKKQTHFTFHIWT